MKNIDNQHLWFREFERLQKKYEKGYECCDDERFSLMVVALLNCEKKVSKR